MHAEWPMHASGLMRRARPSVIARMSPSGHARMHEREPMHASMSITGGSDMGASSSPAARTPAVEIRLNRTTYVGDIRHPPPPPTIATRAYRLRVIDLVARPFHECSRF